jgi:hypothetical protein
MNDRMVQITLHPMGLKRILALWWAVGLGVLSLSATGARAQRMQAERIVIQADGRVGEAMAAAEQAFDLPPEVVNQWIFGGNLQPDDGRKRLEQQLQVRLEELTEHCGLSTDQVGKLRRAGRGDVTRFLRSVGEVQHLVTVGRRDMDMAQVD